MTLKIGVIGCGLKAASYARAWVKSPLNPDFTALTDTNQASVDRYAEIVRQAGGTPRIYPTAEALLEAEAKNLDAVYISTPHAFHAGYAKAALEQGLNLLLEKPMSLNAAEAREIIEARDRAGRQVVVAYQASLSPLLDRMRKRGGRRIRRTAHCARRSLGKLAGPLRNELEAGAGALRRRLHLRHRVSFVKRGNAGLWPWV
ncbi:Gfo/Idh/MocA family oxidoreductase [Rhizobium sp. RCAM05350]|nr:Gfo/Idh/MocA family oxidoreductase [Rhizobium sp. RCAM05350]